jgi:tRNA(adenine34) deaminase
MALWESLSPAWRACWEEGWAAYRDGGNAIIGAAVVDRTGRVCARGRNQVRHRGSDPMPVADHELAHAEVNALFSFPIRHGGFDYALYTLLEPCPLCMGAFYMSGIRHLHFAARDPWAGSANLLGTTRYLSLKPIQVFDAEDRRLEATYVAIHVASMIELRAPDDPGRLVDAWKPGYPAGVAHGRRVFDAGLLPRARERGDDVASVLGQVEERVRGLE